MSHERQKLPRPSRLTTNPAPPILQTRPFSPLPDTEAVSESALASLPAGHPQADPPAIAQYNLSTIALVSPTTSSHPSQPVARLQRQSLPQPLIQRNLIQRDKVKGDATRKINSQDVAYELIAHRLAYKGTGGAEDWLSQQGYEQRWRNAAEGTGLFVGLLMPQAEDSGKRPVLAFKGTTPSQLGDVLADLDPVAVGFTAFKANQAAIQGLITEAGGKVDVVGHSLGGALAQQCASAFPGNVGRVVTFQAPGISQEQVRQFNALKDEERPEVTHHIATGDVVDLAGGKHLGGSGVYTGKGKGDFFLHHISEQGKLNIGSHTQFLLQDGQFAEQQQAMGVDANLQEKLGIADKIGHHSAKNGGVEAFDDNPYWERQFMTERAREGASMGGALAIGGAALAKRGRKNFQQGGVIDKALGVGQMIAGGAGAAVGGVGALAGGLIGGAVGAVGVGAAYAGKGIAKGAAYAGKGIVKGAELVGQGAAATGKAIAKGASSLFNSARNLFGKKKEAV